LQSANKRFGTRICASAAVVEGVPGFKGRAIGDLMLRGRSEPLRAYEPLSDRASESGFVAQYADAFAKLEASDVAAMPAFAALVGANSEDKLAGFHLKRLLNGEKGVRIAVE